MVFGGKGNVLCSRALKDIGPVCGVEEFSVELRSEIVWRLAVVAASPEGITYRIPSGLLR
jgi:hypothetical protein